eukprot:TRINITY_DN44426_c0_g1_i1.p1 TRINITY_DN44426_c0_g1~~TRINITY_DN44426_c0_g1_i1.p1  ORF type:complete len:971 (-),score=166.17 TRINITY_DN44426_c0_g1_i1:130-3042(-)
MPIGIGAAVAAAGLYGYNRENFMFDAGILQERTYFGQEMKVKRWELYREDIHDLTELTVSKMDVYIVVLVLELLFGMMLFTEGMPKPNLTPEWMHWLFASSSATAVLYLVLSTWLAMHASISAHSYGVRMLTTFVRLPIPSTKQIHAASAKATDFEGANVVNDMLRIPYLQQRTTETEDTMTRTWRSEGRTSEQREQFMKQADAPVVDDVAKAPHIQKWRELQVHWQAYDAYCRVCMAMGTNQILHAMCYYCLGVMLAELRMSGFAAFCCIVVFSYSAFLILRLDLLVRQRTLVLVGALQIAAPLATCVCLWGAKVGDNLGSIPAQLEKLVPLAFVLNMLWILEVIYLARGVDDNGSANAVLLPSKFRSVLYLDVFGWLSDRGSGTNAATESGSGAEPVTEQAQGSGANASTRIGSGAEPFADQVQAPSSQHALLRRHCLQIKEQLKLQLEKWECEGARQLVQDDRVQELRTKFDAAAAALAATDPREEESAEQPAHAPTAEVVEAPTVWLKSEWNTSGRPIPCWYNLETGDTRWEPPEAALVNGVQVPCLVLDLELLSMELDLFDEKVKALAVLLREQRLRSSGGADVSSEHFLQGSAETNATFHPHPPEEEAEPSGGEGQMSSSNRPPPGDLPWRTFYQGSMTMVFIWAVGTIWSSAQLYFGIHIPIRPVPGPALSQLWADSAAFLKLELVSDRRWPHNFFNPKGLGCHSTLGPGRIFVAEAHAMHELQLTVGDGRSTDHASWQPALRQCLEQVPDFVADGIRGVSIHCPEGMPRADNQTLQDAGGHCSAVLLGATGESLLSCQLRGHADASASKVATRHLYGGPWGAVAAISETESSSAVGSFWAQGQASLVQFGSQAQRAAGLRQDEAEGSLVPLLEVSDDDIGQHQVEHMVALPDGSAVLTLTSEGLQLRSLARPQQRQKLQLPQDQGSRWAGICAPGGRELLLVGRRTRSEEYALWRTKLPPWL